MDWFKLTGLGLDIRPSINSQKKKNIAPKSPSIQATIFLACKVGVFCSAKDDSLCSSTILDVKTDTELGRIKNDSKGEGDGLPLLPQFFNCCQDGVGDKYTSELSLEKTSVLQSTKFVKINFDDQDDHHHVDADDDTA